MTSMISTHQAQPTVATDTNGQTGSLKFSPRFDIWEGDSEYVLYGDLPGVKPDELDVHYENRQLTIHGKVAPRHPAANCVMCEYGVGDFERVFSLGEAIDYEAITAELRDGVLAVHLPKPDQAKPRRIQVSG